MLVIIHTALRGELAPKNSANRHQVAPYGNLVKKGWLLRLTRKQWSQHWFVLKNGSLTYYRGPAAELCSFLDGVLDLSLIKQIQQEEQEEQDHNHQNITTGIAVNNGSTSSGGVKTNNSDQNNNIYAFSLKMWNGEHHVLAASSLSDRTQWLEAILESASMEQEDDGISISNSSTKSSPISNGPLVVGSHNNNNNSKSSNTIDNGNNNHRHNHHTTNHYAADCSDLSYLDNLTVTLRKSRLHNSVNDSTIIGFDTSSTGGNNNNNNGGSNGTARNRSPPVAVNTIAATATNNKNKNQMTTTCQRQQQNYNNNTNNRTTGNNIKNNNKTNLIGHNHHDTSNGGDDAMILSRSKMILRTNTITSATIGSNSNNNNNKTGNSNGRSSNLAFASSSSINTSDDNISNSSSNSSSSSNVSESCSQSSSDSSIHRSISPSASTNNSNGNDGLQMRSSLSAASFRQPTSTDSSQISHAIATNLDENDDTHLIGGSCVRDDDDEDENGEDEKEEDEDGENEDGDGHGIREVVREVDEDEDEDTDEDEEDEEDKDEENEPHEVNQGQRMSDNEEGEEAKDKDKQKYEASNSEQMTVINKERTSKQDLLLEQDGEQESVRKTNNIQLSFNNYHHYRNNEDGVKDTEMEAAKMISHDDDDDDSSVEKIKINHKIVTSKTSFPFDTANHVNYHHPNHRHHLHLHLHQNDQDRESAHNSEPNGKPHWEANSASSKLEQHTEQLSISPILNLTFQTTPTLKYIKSAIVNSTITTTANNHHDNNDSGSSSDLHSAQQNQQQVIRLKKRVTFDLSSSSSSSSSSSCGSSSPSSSSSEASSDCEDNDEEDVGESEEDDNNKDDDNDEEESAKEEEEQQVEDGQGKEEEDDSNTSSIESLSNNMKMDDAAKGVCLLRPHDQQDIHCKDQLNENESVQQPKESTYNDNDIKISLSQKATDHDVQLGAAITLDLSEQTKQILASLKLASPFAGLCDLKQPQVVDSQADILDRSNEMMNNTDDDSICCHFYSAERNKEQASTEAPNRTDDDHNDQDIPMAQSANELLVSSLVEPHQKEDEEYYEDGSNRKEEDEIINKINGKIMLVDEKEAKSMVESLEEKHQLEFYLLKDRLNRQQAVIDMLKEQLRARPSLAAPQVVINSVDAWVQSDEREREQEQEQTEKNMIGQRVSTIDREDHIKEAQHIIDDRLELRKRLSHAEKNMKSLTKQLRDSYSNYDCLEISYNMLKQGIKCSDDQHNEELHQMKLKVNDLTNKLLISGRQLTRTRNRLTSKDLQKRLVDLERKVNDIHQLIMVTPTTTIANHHLSSLSSKNERQNEADSPLKEQESSTSSGNNQQEVNKDYDHNHQEIKTEIQIQQQIPQQQLNQDHHLGHNHDRDQQRILHNSDDDEESFFV